MTVKTWMPSNHTEFEAFYQGHCVHCIKDDPETEMQCPLIAQAFDQDQPSQWIVDDAKGRICTGYEEDHNNPRRCTETPSLF